MVLRPELCVCSRYLGHTLGNLPASPAMPSGRSTGPASARTPRPKAAITDEPDILGPGTHPREASRRPVRPGAPLPMNRTYLAPGILSITADRTIRSSRCTGHTWPRRLHLVDGRHARCMRHTRRVSTTMYRAYLERALTMNRTYFYR
jgi:hypothetical protein